MHAIYTTPGFIIDSRAYGEADKIVSIFTRDLGLVSAVAKGIRLEQSKLRYFAQDHANAIFSLVRGRDLWRLTSAQDPKAACAMRTEAGARVLALLRRLLHGEESHPELYASIDSFNSFLSRCADLDDERKKTLESLVVFRIMDDLGYIGNDAEMDQEIVSAELSLGLLDRAAKKRIQINKHINKALKESHL